MGDNEIDIKEAQALIDGEKLGVVDKIVGRLISRKFFVFLTATGLLIWSTLDPDTWGMIAMWYIGGQSAIDMVNAWNWGK